MASQNQQAVSLSIILLVRIDVQRGAKLGFEIAKENKGIFQGIYVQTLPNPNRDRDVQNISFIVRIDSVNNVIEQIKKGLNLTDENFIPSTIPSTLPEEKPQPKSMVS